MMHPNPKDKGSIVKILLNVAHYNERSEKLVFFRDNRARSYKANVVSVAHEFVQKWNFDWLHVSKEEFKRRLKLINDTDVTQFPHQRRAACPARRFFPLVGQLNVSVGLSVLKKKPGFSSNKLMADRSSPCSPPIPKKAN